MKPLQWLVVIGFSGQGIVHVSVNLGRKKMKILNVRLNSTTYETSYMHIRMFSKMVFFVVCRSVNKAPVTHLGEGLANIIP